MILGDSFLEDTVVRNFKYHLYFSSKFGSRGIFVSGIVVLMLVIMEKHHFFSIFMKINFPSSIPRMI